MSRTLKAAGVIALIAMLSGCLFPPPGGGGGGGGGRGGGGPFGGFQEQPVNQPGPR
ncbi:hypothetical protein AAGW04_13410 [Pectobacterium aroidearum]|jgi:hypothetical protein|uniref:Lipoprotein n=1 Tax=Pectobacterium carotovorum subsp. carotovorum (strain PC1) TaxID=561230 RepID=C6DGR0_PECCP|nr:MULTISPECIES: hypothetical protein [Pectobacterium]ACT11147.1 conserved hypothetical protein [Pectobacterium carotovorum subsp. carotovorum PC1]MBA0206337.1 hypothetical protein [Pectobacterium aroidearum]MDY4386003.1 hypothetical protein [Pectobacterium aroidearum]UUE36483.1 hypothetical protein L0Y26_00490 [Pectobacterium aroidearum]UUE40858.1 hypothetical protein L0Y25_00490 [Pectobacterium aroidearum]